MITLYDVDAKAPFRNWSLNIWKARYVLNYKRLPYRTIRLEYPDIESSNKSVGIPPSGTWPDRVTPYFSCPAITDDATGAAITDSYKITEYLDKQYPDTPKAIPPGTETFHIAFYYQFNQLIDPIWPLVVPRVPAILNPPSAEYFIRTRAGLFGKPLVELAPAGEALTETWAEVKANFGKIDEWLSKSSGPFFGGETPVFADFMVAGMFYWVRVVFSEDSKEWRDIEEWHNGRWKNLLAKLEQYANTEY